MVQLKSIEAMKQTGNAAVRRLRKQKFAKGLPFMINSRDLPQNESYLEYPDGRMVIIRISGSLHNFTVVKEIPVETSVSTSISHARLIYHYRL